MEIENKIMTQALFIIKELAKPLRSVISRCGNHEIFWRCKFTPPKVEL